MLRGKFFKSNKAQVGETLTWVIATLTIIVLLTLSIYAAIALGKIKSIDTKKTSLKFVNSQGEIIDEFDRMKLKTFLAFELNSNNKEKIETWIFEGGLND